MPSLPATPLSDASPALLRFLESHLAPGETVTWRGHAQSRRPPPMIRFMIGLWHAFVAVMIGGILYIVGGIALSSFRAGKTTEAAVFLGFGLVMASLCLITLPFVKRLTNTWAETSYLLTDRRALIAGPVPTRGYTALTFTPDQLRGMRRTVTRPDGSGSLVFTNNLEKDDEGHEHRIERGFLDVAQVEAVERLIHQMLHRLDETGR